MAKILRGKNKGQVVTLHQWANDWVTTQEFPQPFRVRALVFREDEIRRMRKDRHVGVMFQEFEVVEGRDGFIFKKKWPKAIG